MIFINLTEEHTRLFNRKEKAFIELNNKCNLLMKELREFFLKVIIKHKNNYFVTKKNVSKYTYEYVSYVYDQNKKEHETREWDLDLLSIEKLEIFSFDQELPLLGIELKDKTFKQLMDYLNVGEYKYNQFDYKHIWSLELTKENKINLELNTEELCDDQKSFWGFDKETNNFIVISDYAEENKIEELQINHLIHNKQVVKYLKFGYKDEKITLEYE